MVLLTFKGGIHPDDGKRFSKDQPIRPVVPQGELVYPLSQHIGAPAKPVVKKGDCVLKGQLIAEAGGFVSSPIYSSVSGKVKGLEQRFNPTGSQVECIVVENDGEYKEVEYEPVKPLEEMTREEIINKIGDAGIVGMGGAGFPTKVKLSPKEPDKIEYIIANCAECEPYITADYRRMLEYTEDLVSGMKVILSLFPNARGVFAVEDNKKDCIEKLQKAVAGEPRIDVKALMTKYPQGAERQLIYAVTKRAINSTMLPADAGCIVDNVETLIGIHNAVIKGKPLMERVVTVSGDAVEKPGNFMAPFGINHRELVEAAGGLKAEPQKLISGGPMMGFIGSGSQPVTKTTNAVLVLPQDHYLVKRKRSKSSIDMKRAAACCCQCSMCTDLCPRHLLGHPIQPHLFMRAATCKDVQQPNIFINTFFCCSCGVCELYSCPQELSPRTLMLEYKNGLRANGLRAPEVTAVPVGEERSYRRVPMERLMSRLDLTKYNKEAPLDESVIPVKRVKIMLSQHIGAPASCVVKPGDMVVKGQMIAEPAKGLSVGIHASVNGLVSEVNEKYVVIETQEGRADNE